MRQRQTELCEFKTSLVHDSQDYTKKHCLENLKKKCEKGLELIFSFFLSVYGNPKLGVGDRAYKGGFIF